MSTDADRVTVMIPENLLQVIDGQLPESAANQFLHSLQRHQRWYFPAETRYLVLILQ
jgi:hypothetical protein